jgi:hypothetical protein|nr:MAG TPA: hypothetical protein [Caudoviricetes sp.]
MKKLSCLIFVVMSLNLCSCKSLHNYFEEQREQERLSWEETKNAHWGSHVTEEERKRSDEEYKKFKPVRVSEESSAYWDMQKSYEVLVDHKLYQCRYSAPTKTTICNKLN